MEIKLLDCTLRDGGYKNNWNFELLNSKCVVKNLDLAGVNYIETGFLKDVDYDINRTLFSEINQINNIVNEDCSAKISAMIMFNQFNEAKIVKKTSDIALDTIRLTFKKEEIPHELFLNPKDIHTYSLNEIQKLTLKVNEIAPFAFSIVDTKGVLDEKELILIYDTIESELNSKIELCFHSHNTTGNSFKNAKKLLEMNKKRNLILDSTIFGIGKGTGNLNTKEIMKFLKKDTSQISFIDECEFVLKNVYDIVKV